MATTQGLQTTLFYQGDTLRPNSILLDRVFGRNLTQFQMSYYHYFSPAMFSLMENLQTLKMSWNQDWVI